MANPNYDKSDFAIALEKAYQTTFQGVTADYLLSSVPGLDRVVMTTTSDGASEDYAFDTSFGIPTRTDDGHPPAQYGFDDEKYTLDNREWTAEYKVKRSVKEDDRHGFIARQMASAPVGARLRYISEIATLVAAATATVCHDGQYLIDTDHTTGWPAGNQTNADQNKLITTVDLATSVTNAAAVMNVMAMFKDRYGNYLTGRMDTVLTGHTIAGTAWDILAKSATIPGLAGMGANPIYGQVEVVHLPQLTTATTWYGINAGMGYKPFVWQNRISAEAEAFDPDASMPDYLVRVRMRGRAGCGPWWTIILGDA